MKKETSAQRSEPNSSMSFSMGLVLALSLLLFAFEWSAKTRKFDMCEGEAFVSETMEIDLNVKLPQPPKPKQPEIAAPDEIIIKDEPVALVETETTEDAFDKPMAFSASVPRPPGGRMETPDETVWDFAEISPEFLGGQAALMQFLANAIRYPRADIELGVEGRVVCTFVVEKDGSITDINILRGVSPSIDKEAMRVVAQMPNWKPGFQNGRAVRVKFTLPILFKLKR